MTNTLITQYRAARLAVAVSLILGSATAIAESVNTSADAKLAIDTINSIQAAAVNSGEVQANNQATLKMNTEFPRLDADDDLRISRTEADSNSELKANFDSLDMNGDGQLTAGEFSRLSARGDTSVEAEAQGEASIYSDEEVAE